MLDNQNFKLIKKLTKLCDGGSYKVFDIEDLTTALGLNADELNNNLKHLKANDYIDIKYFDESAVCLCMLPKSREIQEQEHAKKFSYKNIMNVLLLSGLFTGIMAFLGAFVAVLIIK